MTQTNEAYPDILVFDVDGVLVDASRSYPCVVAQSLLWAWIKVLGRIPDCDGFSLRHFSITKTHPAFNDDYDIAWAFINCVAARNTPSLSKSLPSPEEWRDLLDGCVNFDIADWVSRTFSETVPRETMRQVCEEMYFGCDEYEAIGETPLFTTRRRGLWEEERPLVSFHWKDLPLPVAIYTGRPLKELHLALKLIGWDDFPLCLAVTPDSGITKPSPLGIAMLCEKTGTSSPLFLGDTESDRQALRAFGSGRFAAIGDYLPEEHRRYPRPEDALRDAGIIR